MTASWATPYGTGRPGWHLECSAMARRYLGDTFDIHGGGIDLRFPHHENEQAQSHAAGLGFARYWLHNAWVTVKGQKMGKSLGNSLEVGRVVEVATPTGRPLLPHRRALPLDHRVPRGLAHRGRRDGRADRGLPRRAPTGCAPWTGVNGVLPQRVPRRDGRRPQRLRGARRRSRHRACGQHRPRRRRRRRGPRGRRGGRRDDRGARREPALAGLGQRRCRRRRRRARGARRARRRPARCSPVRPRGKGFRGGRRDPRPARRGGHRHRGHALRGALVVGPTGRSADMAGNSQRRGAVRKSSARRRDRRVRRATPKRLGGQGAHAQGRRARVPPGRQEGRRSASAAVASRAAPSPGMRRAARPQGRPARGSGRSSGEAKASSEVVAGRNAVVEALRADVPVTTMYVAGRIDADDRVREALKTAAERSIPILETPRGELDRLTDGAVHQGLAAPGAAVRLRRRHRPRRPGGARHPAGRRPRRRHRPAQPRRGRSAPSPRSAVTASCCPSAGRPA